MFSSAHKPLRTPRSRTALTVASAAAALLVAPAFLPGSPAHADPSADQWHQLRMCESTNNYAIDTGNGYYGAYQFNLETWQSVGGAGYPHQASPQEQDARALELYYQRGWQPWTCATKLGFDDEPTSGAESAGTSSAAAPTDVDQQSFPAS